MAQETIFVQTDPSFDIVLRSLNELNARRRLEVTHIQTAVIERIQSDKSHHDNRYLFGAQNNSCIQSFARTASAVARMCMLRATNVEEKHWPKIGALSASRNKNMLNGQGQNQVLGVGKFVLATNEDAARWYYSKYDHLYPHYRIEEKVRSAAVNQEVSLPSMMLIISSNFTRVVEITTAFRATHRRRRVINRFHCYINVVCIVRSIKEQADENGSDGPFTQLLRGLVENSDGLRASVDDNYFEVLSSATKLEDFMHLFKNLNFVEPANEEGNGEDYVDDVEEDED